MGFFDRFFNNKKEVENRNLTSDFYSDMSYLYSGSMNYNSYSNFIQSNSMKLSAVYSAVNAISNAVATLPINVFSIDVNGYKKLEFQNDIYNILNFNPSPNVTRFKFIKQLVSSVLLKGNGYAQIIRENGRVKQLKYIHPDNVTVLKDNVTGNIKYRVLDIKNLIDSSDMLHFWIYSTDMLSGVSVLSHAANVLKSASDAEVYSSSFFRSGAATNGVLTTTNSLNKEQAGQLKSNWNTAFTDQNALGVVVLPVGVDYKPISINSKDAQLLESRQFSVNEIARFFNISPIKLFDLQNASYSTLEQTQLSFLQDTINPYLIMFEQEFVTKLFDNKSLSRFNVQFDVTAMLSTDKQATANYYKDLMTSGVMTINEVRRALNLNDVENGDHLFMQLNMSTVDNIINESPSPVNTDLQQKTKSKVKKDKSDK